MDHGEAASALTSEGRAVQDDAAAPVGFETLYRRLRAICRHRMEGERVDHTLQATALANEVFLRLFSLDAEKARNPEGATRWFVANAVIAVRQVLVDHARGVGRKKRGGGRRPVLLGDGDAPATGSLIDSEVAERIRTVDTLLAELATVSTLQSEIVALRFFGGLTFAQISAQVGIPETTVRREWALARIWMGESRAAAGWGGDG
ncbi:MAG: hypothetical protein GC172_14160 [Phycisphaera sp.]|nr:hypothetical protein [Phycisphaera sp.]